MKVLMVCLGNICRSPIAEGILQDRIEHQQLDWEVDSAGTSGWHNGAAPHEESILVSRSKGIDITKQVSRLFVPIDFDRFDLIIAMDSSNYANILQLARNTQDEEKVKLLLNYLYPGMNKAVPDPYYEGGFGLVFDEIEQAIDKMIVDFT